PWRRADPRLPGPGGARRDDALRPLLGHRRDASRADGHGRDAAASRRALETRPARRRGDRELRDGRGGRSLLPGGEEARRPAGEARRAGVAARLTLVPRGYWL